MSIGEGHGFKKAENIQLALDGEYFFICRVLGIQPTVTIPEEKVMIDVNAAFSSSDEMRTFPLLVQMLIVNL